MRVKIVANPTANHGETAQIIDKIENFLTGKIAFNLELTQKPKHAIDISKNLFDYDLVIAVGGDGTAHEIVNGLALSNNNKTALGIIPTGSGNDFARMLGISEDPLTACQQILNGFEKVIDLGMVNGIYYANSLGIGFDARVAHLANEVKEESKKTGFSLYLSCVFSILFSDYYCFDIAFKIDNSNFENKRIVLIAVNNGKTYGRVFRITPRAVNDDGFLDVCLVDELSAFQVVPRLPFVIAGKHEWMKQVHTLRAKKVIIRSEETLPAQLDGELIEDKNFLIEVVPKALKIRTTKETKGLVADSDVIGMKSLRKGVAFRTETN
ncbi:MAG: diacylglycerol kinase family lipid kinase [Candidatus Subteraquimicrobiales bacterium]|nr:diacylglycerol kinase family lipid kinase [Candidatus Subteraquimicrobiales bacterium]